MDKDGKKAYESRKRQFNRWSIICMLKAKQSQAGIHSIHSISEKMFTHHLGGRASAFIKLVWRDKNHNHHLSFFPFSLIFYCWAWHDKEYDTGQSGSVALAMSPSNVSSASASSLSGQSGNRKNLHNVQAFVTNGWNTGVLLRVVWSQVQSMAP